MSKLQNNEHFGAHENAASSTTANSTTAAEQVSQEMTRPIMGWGRRNTAGVSIASSLKFSSVSHQYDQKRSLQDVSLEVRAGEVMCLLGPSGSGKTSLLKVAAGLLEPVSGSVHIDKRLVCGDGTFVVPEKRGVGLVFQDFALFPHLNIINNVQFGLTALGKKERFEHAMRLLERVGLSKYAQEYPHNLSGGEQQRVALARALAPRPGILLMDEPFSGLDVRLRQSIRDETLSLLRDTRSTVLIVTHDPEEALSVSDRIALMKGGKLEQIGTPSEIYAKPKSQFVAGFFSELNVFAGRYEGKNSKGSKGNTGGNSGVVVSEFGTIRKLEKINAGVGVDHLLNGDKVNLCIRQSDFILEEIIDVNAKTLSEAGSAKIVGRRFLGNVEILDLLMVQNDLNVKVRVKVGTLSQHTQFLKLTIDENKAMIFKS
ncbi:MAG: ABC transporter ATP-binding protein [Nitratireductor sp.]